MNSHARKSIIALSIFAVASLGLTAGSPFQEESIPGGKPIRIRVGMVSLPVVVTNERGEYVTDLQKEDFSVVDNGRTQEIAGFAAVEEPISVALTLDGSDSMKAYLNTIQNEAIRFVGFLKKEDGLAILSFADEVVLWEPFSLYGKKNPMAIRRIEAGGMSAVYEAVWLALEQVLKHEFGRKALVLFSDGIDNRSRTVTEQETLDLAGRTEATIYCIYFNSEKKRFGRFPFPGDGGEKKAEYAAGREYLAKLSESSGGVLVDAGEIGDLGAAFRKIARELSSQYSIGYYPSNLLRNGEFHNVEVRLRTPGLTARTKKGYYGPDE
ncbi:MAG: VWA domain-containing protein [Acidobacteria bacterium]|nr:VWA domain-containing protein [Acidobacteriota bacterium]